MKREYPFDFPFAGTAGLCSALVIAALVIMDVRLNGWSWAAPVAAIFFVVSLAAVCLLSDPRCECHAVRRGRRKFCRRHDERSPTYGTPDLVAPVLYRDDRECIVPLPDDFARRPFVNGRQCGGITREPGIQ